jgi:hypothetical protein
MRHRVHHHSLGLLNFFPLNRSASTVYLPSELMRMMARNSWRNRSIGVAGRTYFRQDRQAKGFLLPPVRVNAKDFIRLFVTRTEILWIPIIVSSVKPNPCATTSTSHRWARAPRTLEIPISGERAFRLVALPNCGRKQNQQK